MTAEPSCRATAIENLPPLEDPALACDQSRCAPAPTEPLPCADNDAEVSRLTKGLVTSCEAGLRYFPNTCTDENAQFYDAAIVYCRVTCGLCEPELAAAAEPQSVDAAADNLFTTVFPDGYENPCAFVPTAVPASSGLSRNAQIGIAIGIVLIILVVFLVVRSRRRSRRRALAASGESAPLAGGSGARVYG